MRLVEANIGNLHLLSAPHPHKALKSTNLLERLNQKLKRRTHVVRIFTDGPVAHHVWCEAPHHPETHEDWIDSNRYLNMEPLRESIRHPNPAA